jgi:Ala-tRNA(Pro) deacylase
MSAANATAFFDFFRRPRFFAGERGARLGQAAESEEIFACAPLRLPEYSALFQTGSQPARNTMAATRADLFAYFDRLGIAHSTIEHPPLPTVEAAMAVWGGMSGGFAKNLFVKDKKSRLFLITLRKDAALDLKHVQAAIGASGRVSFCSAEQLMQHLGILPGSVTPLAAINDTAGAVTVVLERSLLELDPVHVHPLENTATTALSADGLLAFLRATGHEPLVVDLPLLA